MTLTMRLTHVARAYKAAADRMAGDFDLSHATAWPMIMISRMGDGVRPGAVAEALGLEPPSLVRVLDQLVLAGLVERHDDASDRRAKTLHLTPNGRDRAARLEDALRPFRASLFAGVSEADIATCTSVLSALDDAITASGSSRSDADPA
ncbi:Transcriptional regulator, MarR family [Oxalobacteraceae bacterium IMCC9480]|nr:Transcriptional regulator, MarR family [Oxalobacteraceae bacterium IMCC9480]